MDEEEFESWEFHFELHERRDYPALVLLCESEVNRNPHDLHAHERLGHAYVLNGDYDKAIRSMGRCHRQFPDIDAFQHIILDALFAQGKTEHDFEWVSAPVILRLGTEVCDICYDYLRPKRKPRSVMDLYPQLMFRGYLAFNEDELLQALNNDERFLVTDDQFWDAEVSVSRKRR